MDLVQWLTAQLDEDERIAREAIEYVDADWCYDSSDNVALASGLTVTGQQMLPITADRWRRPMVDGPGFVPHVAAHDPARVLREVEAKRQLLDEHQDVNDGSCGTCVDGQWGYPTHGSASPQRYPCKTLRLLALPYADRPGYEEALASLA